MNLIYCLRGPSWLWSYGSWIYNYLCNQYLSPLTLWVWTLLRRGVLDTTLCDKWHTAGRWFSPGTLVSSFNKTDCNDITEILLKVTFNTKHPPNPLYRLIMWKIKTSCWVINVQFIKLIDPRAKFYFWYNNSNQHNYEILT